MANRYMRDAGRLLRKEIAALADFCGLEARCHKGWVTDTWVFIGDRDRIEKLIKEMERFPTYGGADNA